MNKAQMYARAILRQGSCDVLSPAMKAVYDRFRCMCWAWELPDNGIQRHYVFTSKLDGSLLSIMTSWSREYDVNGYWKYVGDETIDLNQTRAV